MSTASASKTKKVDELAELRGELMGMKVTLSVLGDSSESSKKLVTRKQVVTERIRQLEEELESEAK